MLDGYSWSCVNKSISILYYFRNRKHWIVHLSERVKRFTNLSNVIDILRYGRITLLSPTRWDDTNDSYLIELYRISGEYRSVLAFCCTRATETYHHWRVFTTGSEGICIEFDRQALESAISEISDIRSGKVLYLKVNELAELKNKNYSLLPFIKRQGFRDEREWRIIGYTKTVAQEALQIPINIKWIRRLVINPWMPQSMVKSVRECLNGIENCALLRIDTSRLTNSRKWKAAGRRISELRWCLYIGSCGDSALNPRTFCISKWARTRSHLHWWWKGGYNIYPKIP